MLLQTLPEWLHVVGKERLHILQRQMHVSGRSWQACVAPLEQSQGQYLERTSPAEEMTGQQVPSRLTQEMTQGG